MEPAMLLIFAGLAAMIALPLVAAVLAVTMIRLHRTEIERNNLAALVKAPVLQFKPVRRPDQWPAGTIPVELALAVHEEWRKAGYHMLGDTRVVLRLLSIAHRVMCQHQLSSLAPATYNDGDRTAPAKVQCVAEGKRTCTWPDCHCEAIPDPLPPARPKPNRPGKKG